MLHAVNRDAQNRVVGSFDSTDGVNYTRRTGNNPPSAAENGTFSVRQDGTFEFRTSANSDPTDRSGRRYETLSNGTLRINFTATGGLERQLDLRTDGAQIWYNNIGGQMRPVSLRNGNTNIFVDYRGGTEPQLVRITENGQTSTYERVAGQQNQWRHREANRVGELTLQNGITPQFRPLENVEAPPQPQGDRPESSTPRGRALLLQESLNNLLQGMHNARMAEHGRRIEQELRQAAGPNGQIDAAQFQTRLQQAEQASRRQMEEDRRALQAEQQQMRNSTNPEATWAQSPVTQRLYREAVQWLESQAVPGTMQQIRQQGGIMQPGAPIGVPQVNGQFMNPALFRAGTTDGTIQLNLGIPGTRPGDTTPIGLPSENQLGTLNQSFDWLLRTRRQQDQARLDYELNTLLPQVIRDNGLPQGWLQEIGMNPEARRDAMRQMIDLALTVRNLSTAIAELKIPASIASLPPGVRPEYDSNGRLLRLNLDLPQNLDMQNPANLRRIEELQRWVAQVRGPVQQAVNQYADSQQNEGRRIFFGQLNSAGRVLTDENGRPVRIMRPDEPANPRERPFNLLDCEYTTQTNPDGTITVNATVQPRNSHFYNYLNLGAENVTTQPFTTQLGPFQPNDPVVINDSSGNPIIVPARELESRLSAMRLSHYGGMALTATMDIGMTVASLGAASGAVIAARAAWAAGRSGMGILLRQGGMALIRGGLGASGFALNNNAALNDPFWSRVNEIRGYAMIADVTQGTLRHLGSAVGLLRLGQGAEAAAGLQRAIAQSGWIFRGLHRAEQGAHLLMETTNIPYALMMTHDITALWGQLQNPGQQTPFERAQRLLQGSDQQGPPRDAAEAQRRQTLEEQRANLNTYMEQLTRGRPPEVQEQIRNLFREASQLLGDNATPQQREEFRNRLLTQLYGNPQDVGARIAARESELRRQLSPAELREITASAPNPDKRLLCCLCCSATIFN